VAPPIAAHDHAGRQHRRRRLLITIPFGALGSFDLDFFKGCFGYFVSVAGPAGKSPPFPDATAQAYEKALALDAVPNL